MSFLLYGAIKVRIKIVKVICYQGRQADCHCAKVAFQDQCQSLGWWMPGEKVSWPDFAMARLNSLLKCTDIFWVVLSHFIIALDKIEYDFLGRWTPWRWFSLSCQIRYVLCICVEVHLYLFNPGNIREGKFKKQTKLKTTLPKCEAVLYVKVDNNIRKLCQNACFEI